ncbi:MAG: alpha/beta hydrolase [Deltaproteobacteria bacterium]|nr:alpha/beta hydrolase [Deltaproteobacteria bacterium]
MQNDKTVDGVCVSFLERGQGNSHLLVHGSGANKDYWHHLANQLRPHHVIQPDLLGHGETPAWHFMQQAPAQYHADCDLKLLETVLKDVPAPIKCVGHSAGGALCLEYARRNPHLVHSLVLFEPMVPSILKNNRQQAWQEVSEAYQKANALVDEERQEEGAEYLFDYILGEQSWQRMPDFLKKLALTNTRTLAGHSLYSIQNEMPLEWLSDFQKPVLLLCGDQSREPFRAICEELQKRLPKAELRVLAGLGHNAPVTHPEQVNPLILDFFANWEGC